MANAFQLPMPFFLPEGFVYRPDFIPREEEQDLLRRFAGLPFRPFEFQGYTALRRIVGYGLEYDFNNNTATSAPEVPEFLHSLRRRVAAVAGIAPERLVQASITEYSAGAPIGWHRDRPQFETICGVSLAGGCRMRFRPYYAKQHERSQIVSVDLEPRSMYVIAGAARSDYEHSIPPVEALRYSITFRTLRAQYAGGDEGE